MKPPPRDVQNEAPRVPTRSRSRRVSSDKAFKPTVDRRRERGQASGQRLQPGLPAQLDGCSASDLRARRCAHFQALFRDQQVVPIKSIDTNALLVDRPDVAEQVADG